MNAGDMREQQSVSDQIDRHVVIAEAAREAGALRLAAYHIESALALHVVLRRLQAACVFGALQEARETQWRRLAS